MSWNTLSLEEARIIVGQGTEAPFTGEYDPLFRPGIYLCRRCNTPLYDAKAKFDAGCGWPAFDADFPGAVKRLTDADGRRTEIRCAHCDAHLGHVFEGEHLTEKDTRHCVNSLSMRFVPADKDLPPVLDKE
ncbi:MAG: methionine-R-sulfoxide reductase [Undibacterium sp.]